MKIFRLSVFAAAALLMGISMTSCTDANDYKDSYTDNPAFGLNHPETLVGSKYVRASDVKYNVYGEEIQGFVESLDFVKEDSVAVKMSQGTTEGVWTDESNTEKVPLYEYVYNNADGSFTIKKRVVDDKGKVSKTDIFMGTATSDSWEMITIVHYGDTPIQTYLVKQ
jgi:hypothetical protein